MRHIAKHLTLELQDVGEFLYQMADISFIRCLLDFKTDDQQFIDRLGLLAAENDWNIEPAEFKVVLHYVYKDLSMNKKVMKIINVANELLRRNGSTGGSCSEMIAAALVLNRIDFLPDTYPHVLDALERLDNCRQYVDIVRADYMDLIDKH